MIKTLCNLGTAAAVSAMLFGATVAQAQWQPDGPVSIVVPWSAGGSTDTVTRVLAGELTEALGQSVVIINQPGASGSVGTRSVWDAPHDGMMMAAGAAADLGAYPVLGMLDATLSDWRLYLHVANPGLISVPADSDIESFDQLLEALQNADEPLTVATAGLTSAGAIAMGAIDGAADVNYRQIVYEGGNPAVIATVAGETDFTSQTATEQVDMIRAERLRPLAVIASSPLELDGYGTVPAVTDWLPDLQSANNYFGVWIPADAPQEVFDAMDTVWEDAIMNSRAMMAFAAERGALFDPSYGDAAQAAAMPMLSINAWQQYDGGTAENSPEDFDIPRP